jgi:hypothetical protein
MASAEDVAAWIAIQQPAVVRLIETSLQASPDAQAVALGLTATLFEEAGALGGARRIPRVPAGALALELTPDPPLAAWIDAQLQRAPVVLTRAEERAVAAVVTQVAGALAR